MYNTTYAAEQLALWEHNEWSRYDSTIPNIAFMNWKQLLGNDTAIVELAHQALDNSTNVIDQAKLSFLQDYAVPQMEMTMGDVTIGPGYPPEGDPLYGSDFVSLLGILSK